MKTQLQRKRLTGQLEELEGSVTVSSPSETLTRRFDGLPHSLLMRCDAAQLGVHERCSGRMQDIRDFFKQMWQPDDSIAGA